MPAKPKQLTLGTFRVRQLAVETDVRGQAMRRVDLSALDGEALQPTSLPEGMSPAGPDAHVRGLVNPDAAKFLELDATYDLVLVRRDK